MFDISLSDCGVLWHQICVFFIILYQSFIMFLGRSESIKWIRRKFSKRNNTNPPTNVEHTPAKISKTYNENEENLRDLNEILVVNHTPTTGISVSVNNSKNLATIHNNNEVMSTTTTPTTTIPTNQTAPIAREEDAEEGFDETFEEQQKCKNEMIPKAEGEEYEEQYQVINEMAVRRTGGGGSKSSRVRNYLKKCKDRWLAVGLHNQMQEYHNNTGHDPKSTMSTINELDVSQDLRPITTTSAKVTDFPNNRLSSMGGASESKGSPTNCALGNVKKIEDKNNVDDDDDDDDDDVVDESYEDIDFGLGSALTKTAAGTTKKITKQGRSRNSSTNINVVGNSAQIETRQERKHLKSMAQQQKQQEHDHDNMDDDEKHVEQLVDSQQMESHIAALIDRHLACIYPVFTQTTRAVLIREARDVLVKIYHGCLTTFERQFLCKFTEIAVILKERHRVAETNKEPQLYAIWRTPTENPLINTLTSTTTAAKTTTSESGSTLKSCQLDYQDHTLYLSPLALEMLSDDLPQILQSLLIGVENSLERLSLNQLPQIPFNGDGNGGDTSCHNNNLSANTTATGTTTQTSSSSSSLRDEKNHYGTLNGRLQLPNSPKCALRRSELITKNKLHNNKYMLRRLTNRQDSMNSTSSGNSSASGLSNASSDSDSYAKSHLINTATTTTIPQTETKTNELNSPALPRFCLGNSFPHIDSDEENTEDKRNSLTDGSSIYRSASEVTNWSKAITTFSITARKSEEMYQN
ncbi:uncharacterized protein LOC111680493 [Lucilia cuprina]|uniref:uncharacterized protein LOC111680493 n=1 Tax=Lucilia cuprina TaxID=7375 RepID=UPI001F069CF0|nr:uncharacterized protein LOC111680493 [Lucilia cuprina]